MGLPVLPDEIMMSLQDRWPCRDLELRQLATLLNASRPSPSNLIVYGPHVTGKTAIVKAYLEASNIRHAFLRCQECVTGRHFLERTVAIIRDALRSETVNGDATGYDGRCENISALANQIQRLLGNQREKFVLALDGIDSQREAPPTLLPALARIGEIVPNLTVVFIVQHPGPRLLHIPGVPHIVFQAYSKAQCLHILGRRAPDIFHEPAPLEMDYDDETHEEDKAWLWPRFCAAVWDALGQQAARNLVDFREVCFKLWRPFVQPIVKGDFGTRDFSRLFIAQKRLFQEEHVLVDSLIATDTSSKIVSVISGAKSRAHDLPYYAKWLLVAAYLASFNPTRMDAVYFMKSTERKRRKRGGGTRATPNRPSQQRKIPRHLLAASSFPLDRVLSILHAILPHDLRAGIDMYTQIATLSSLRLLVRSGILGGPDPLESGGKWKVGSAVSWEYVQALARSLDLSLVDYVAE